MERLSEALTVLAKLDPVSQGAGTTTPMTDIDISKVRRLLVVLQVGAVGGAGTVDAKLRASKTSGGTYTDITGGAITQVTAANKVVTLEIRDDQVPGIVGAGYQFVQLSLTIGTNAVLVGGVALGGEAEFKPASKNDIAAVTQRLVL
jgi:hypothetical protein